MIIRRDKVHECDGFDLVVVGRDIEQFEIGGIGKDMHSGMGVADCFP